MNSQSTTVTSSVFVVLSIIFVVFRFYTRWMTKAGAAADDWWILVGLLSMILTDGVLVYGQNSDPEHGEMIDRDSPDFDYAPHVTYLKVAFIAAILYFSVVTSIKVSILLMYRRVFSVDSFRRQSLFVGIPVAVWWLVGTILTIVSCIPINRLWVGPSVGGFCFDFNIFWMAMGGVEIVIDVVILVLPVRMILGLQLNRQQKVLLVGIFLLGGFVIVTGIVRVILGYAPGSQNVAFTRAELWSAVHINIAIVCACLPTLRPLLTRALAVVSSISRRLYGSGTGASGGNASAENYSGSSNSAAKNRAGVELKSVRSSNPDDPHASSRQLTRNSGELGLFQYPGPQVFRTDEPEGNAV